LVLEAKQKKFLVDLVADTGANGKYKIRAGVKNKASTSKAQEKALGLKRAKLMKDYLVSLGVKRKNISVSSKVYKAGVAVRTSVSGSKKAIS
jgi:hypothetical protein